MKKFLYLFLIAFTFSCQKEKEVRVIHIDDVDKLGISLQNRSDQDNIRGLNELFDKLAFADLFLRKSIEKRVHEFNAGFVNGFSRSFNFGELLIEQKSDGGSYEFIRAYKDEKNDFHLLFRLYSGGLNYHDYLVKDIRGELKIIDMYIYMSGENLSNSYRTYYKTLLSKSNVLRKDLNEVTAYKDVQKLEKIRGLITARNYKKAHKIYKSISNSSKRTKSFKITNLTITSNLSDELYYEAIKDYEAKFPDDPSLYLISLDGLILKKEFEKCLNYIDKLDELLGGDPFLNFLRGNIYYLKKDYESALGKYAITNLEYPDFIDAYDSALGIYIEQNKKQKVIEILQLYVTRFQADKGELKFNLGEMAPAFTQTKEFKKWFSK